MDPLKNLQKLVLLFMLGYQMKVSSAQFCLGEVRLVNGSGPHEGRLEIFLNYTWRTACADYYHLYYYGKQIASVVCGQLGYLREDVVTYGYAAFGKGSGSIVGEVICNGFERRLIDCNYREYTDGLCDHSQDISVRCLSCQHEGEIRLQGSTSQHSGIVEVCLNGTWGSICATHWDSTDASVVCKQLGYSRYGPMIQYISRPLNWPTHLGDIQCRGDEQHLIECSHVNITSQNCSSMTNSFVTCTKILYCRNGELRITGGNGENEGKVEVCFNEVWGRVCSSNWDQQDATVVCRQLGYSEHGVRAQYEIEYESGPIKLSSVSCSGSETSIIECQYDRSVINSCNHSQYAGVYCNFDTAPAPLGVQMILDQSNNNCIFNWQPSVIAKRHGNIWKYFVNCSAKGFDEESSLNTSTTDALLVLKPHLAYNCCVSAVNEIGLGDPVCQRVVTYEAAPTAPPTSIKTHSLINSTSTFLSWRPPLPQYRNGVIQGYQVEILKVNTTTGFNYTPEDPYLLINDLEQDVLYTCRVAAFTVGMGHFSDIFTINIMKKKEDSLSPLMLILVSISGVFALLLVISLIMLITVCFCCRKYKLEMKNTRCTVQDPLYAMVDLSLNDPSNNSFTTSKQEPLRQMYNTDSALDHTPPSKSVNEKAAENDTDNTHANPSATEEAENTYQPLIPLQAAQKTVSTASEYQSLTLAKPSAAVKTTDEESTYQPLIPLRIRADQKSVSSEYQSLTEIAKNCQNPVSDSKLPPPVPFKTKKQQIITKSTYTA